ncbi:mevalonate kinase [Sitophilus oryzae]|uniref:Mevalonate kinase n=1 Tax=Sitophilus oryzae TaxID=7048 RepID=A0A6J2XTE8_SITOR|nr:mevalonate kinase [Sitophilus oryzae]XP_030754813.1 mevalonate kinase [Sitophilus oryzae]
MSSLGSKSFSYNKIRNGTEFNVSAPGKVILHGEHSVVYGKLAIAASLGLRTRINLVEIDSPDSLVFKIVPMDFEHIFSLKDIEKLLLTESPAISSDDSKFNWENPKMIEHQSQLRIVETALDATLQSHRSGRYETALKSIKCLFYFISGILSSTVVKLKPLLICVDSDLKMGAGTGSSASFSVALATTLIHYLKLATLDLDNVSKKNFKPSSWTLEEIERLDGLSDRQLKAICTWAFCGENLFHGTPSGLDNTICTYGNMVKFRRGEQPTILKLSNASFDVLLIDTHVARETFKLVARVAKLREAFPALVSHILDAMEDLTTRAADLIVGIDGATETPLDDFHDLATLVQMNHGLLCALGVSHQKLEEVIMILEKHDLKGKLTGAGGGGFAIALLPPDYDPEEVVRKLNERDFGVMCTKLGGEGVKIE